MPLTVSRLHQAPVPVLFGRALSAKKQARLDGQIAELQQDLTQLVAWDKTSHAQPVIRSINLPQVLKQARVFLERQQKATVGKPLPFLVAIGGGTAAGTTYTEGHMIQGFKDAARKRKGWTQKQNGPVINAMEMDDYYRDLAKRRKTLGDAKFFLRTNLDSLRSFVVDQFFGDLLKLKNGKAAKIPFYEKKSAGRTDNVRLISPTPFLMVEGLFPWGRRYLRKLYDLKIFVETDDKIRSERWWKRAPSRNVKPDQAGWALFNNAFDRHRKNIAPTMKHADLVIDGGVESQDYLVTLRKLTGVLVKYFYPAAN